MNRRGSTTPSRALCLSCVVGSLALWLAAFLRHRPVSCLIWDDSFMFVRYATRLLHGGGITWNPGQFPTWGSTSLGFLGVVTAVRSVSQEPQTVAFVSSFGSGCLLILLLFVLTLRVASGPRSARWLSLALLLATLSRCADSLGSHFRSGMDTTFAMAYLSAYLIAAHRLAEPTLTPNKWFDAGTITGLLGGAALLIRPDLLVFAVVIPVSIATSAQVEVRRAALRACWLTLLGNGVVWAICSLYFRTPVPLSFYVKSLSFEPAFAELYGPWPALHGELYFRAVLPLLIVIGAGVCFVGRAAWLRRIDVGVAIAAALFIFYYRYRVVQVMHYSQRFYFPSLPALVYLAATSISRLVPVILRTLERFTRAGERYARMFGAVTLVLVAFAELRASTRSVMSAVACPLRTQATVQARLRAIWPGLDAATALPNDLVIATTEVGLPGALNPDKTIVDLSGLNDTDLALRRRSAVQAVLAEHADLVYLHRDYARMNRQFSSNPEFAARYEPHDGAPRATPLSTFVRRDSTFRERLIAAIDSGR